MKMKTEMEMLLPIALSEAKTAAQNMEASSRLA